MSEQVPEETYETRPGPKDDFEGEPESLENDPDQPVDD